MNNINGNYQDAYNNPLNYGFFENDNFEDWINGNHGKAIKEIFENKYRNLFSTKQTSDTRMASLIEIFENKREKQFKAEEKLAKKIGNEKYSRKMEIEDQVKFWTNFFEPQLLKEDKIIFEDWLKIILCSAEFAKTMEDRYPSSVMFSEYLSEEKGRVENRQAVEEALEKPIKGDIIDTIITSINKALPNSAENVDIQRIKREDFKKIKTYEGFKNKTKELIKIELKKLGWTTLEVRINEKTPSFLEMNIEYKLGALGEAKHKNFLYQLSLASKNAINIMFKGKDEIELHIGSGKIKNIKSQTFRLEDIFNLFKKYQEEIKKIAIKKYKDSSVRGFLGEFSRLFLNTQSIELTGTDYDYIEENKKKKSLGESFSDANTTIEGTKIGLNIKHYVSKFDEDSIVLYEPTKDKSGVDIYSSFIRRYFPEEIVQQLRFIDMNYKLFRKNGQNKTYKERISILSYEYLDSFVRISSAANKDFINYFFVINNRYIPTSHIYTKIIETLNQIKDKKREELFNIIGEPQPRRRINVLSSEEMLINNIKKDNMISIQFKGLRIKGLKNFN